ncbi:MAG: DUF1080 domain-containing protein [Gemmataceae bacterium]|nr:DUF1080 domain-containing protein [Gemmataceae bacterium]
MRHLLSFLVALVPCLICAAQVDDREKTDGFVPLFNGKDLTSWKQYAGKPGTWVVEDGLIVCTGRGGGWLGSQRDHANFELRLEYRLKAGGNSGIYIRAPEEGHISRVGMEIQLLDDDHPRYAKLNNYQYTGAIYHVVGPSKRATKAGGEWNALTIRAEGRRVVVAVNGQQVVDADLDQYRKDPAVAKEHPGLARTTGKIGLQSHTDRVEFRRLRIKDLK